VKGPDANPKSVCAVALQASGEEGWLAGAAATRTSDAASEADPAAAAAAAAAAADGAGGSIEQELLSNRPDGVLAAARGSGGAPDVLQVHITAAGPFSKRGTYR
jgi:hypothetical protein